MNTEIDHHCPHCSERRNDEPPRAPDWRVRKVENNLRLSEKGQSPTEDSEVGLSAEKDAYVKQLYAFRMDVACDRTLVFDWATECASNNAALGLGSLIKALHVAKCSPAEIAAWLNCDAEGVEMFLILFGDVRGFQDVPERTCFLPSPFSHPAMKDHVAEREDLLFNAARLKGFAGVEFLFTPNVGLLAAEKRQLEREILIWRADQGLGRWISLQTGRRGSGPGVDRYIRSLRRLVSLPPEDDSGKRRQVFAGVMAAIAGGGPVDSFVDELRWGSAEKKSGHRPIRELQ